MMNTSVSFCKIGLKSMVLVDFINYPDLKVGASQDSREQRASCLPPACPVGRVGKVAQNK